MPGLLLLTIALAAGLLAWGLRFAVDPMFWSRTLDGQLTLLLATLPPILLGTRLPAPPEPDSPRRGGWPGCLAALAVGGALRLVWLNARPAEIDDDGGLLASEAMRLWAQLPAWSPVSPELGVESLFLYLMAGSIELFGVNPFGLRLAGALCSTLTIVAVFGLARELFGSRVGVTAAWLLAVATWPALSARQPLHVHWVALLIACTYWALTACERRGGRWLALLTGLLIGLSLHAFTSYRHGIVVAWVAIGLRRLICPQAPNSAPLRWIVLGCAVPVLAVIPSAVAGGYWDWSANLGRNSLLAEVRESGSLTPVAHNLVTITPHLLMVRLGGDAPGPGLWLGVLFVAGLPLLMRLRDPRCLLLAWLGAALAAPPLVARGDLLHARRFVALVPIMLPITALALVGAYDQAKHRRRLAACLILLGGLGVLLESALELHLMRDRDTRRQAILRRALAAAEGRRVLIPEGAASSELGARFYLLHPQLAELEDDDPLAFGSLDRDLLLLDLDARSPGARLRDLLPRQTTEITLALSPDNKTSTPSSLRGTVISARALRELRQDPTRLEVGGWLHVPRSGRYRVEPAEGLRLGDRALGGGRDEIELARGLTPYRLERPGPAPRMTRLPPPGLRGGHDALEARVAGAAGSRRSVSCSWWKSSLRPQQERSAPLTDDGDSAVLVAERTIEDPNHDGQDVVRGGPFLFVARGGAVLRLLDDLSSDPAWAGLPPIAQRGEVEAMPRAGGIPAISLAASDRHLWRCCPEPPQVVRFTLDGTQKRTMAITDGWIRPVDVAFGNGLLAVADAGRKRVVVLTPDGHPRWQAFTGLVQSVAWTREHLIALDARGWLHRFDLRGRPSKPRRVGAVLPGDRLAASTAGDVLLIRRSRRQLRWLRGQQLVQIDGSVTPFDPMHVWAAHLDPRRGLLHLLHGRLTLTRFERVRIQDRLRPPPNAIVLSETREAKGVAERPDALAAPTIPYGDEASLSIVIPEHAPARGFLWLRLAASRPRPLDVHTSESPPLLAALMITPGTTASDARWQRIGPLDLSGRSIRLHAPEGMPWVFQARLELHR